MKLTFNRKYLYHDVEKDPVTVDFQTWIHNHLKAEDSFGQDCLEDRVDRIEYLLAYLTDQMADSGAINPMEVFGLLHDDTEIIPKFEHKEEKNGN